LLERTAEEMEMQKKLRPEYNHANHTFTVEEKDKFLLTEDGRLFTSYERATIIQHIIATKAGLDTAKMIDNEDMLKCFPLHDKVYNNIVRGLIQL
jgi:hypothetical protein